MEKVKTYLVGTAGFSADCGEFPNAYNFPTHCFATFEEADAKYQELAEKDHGWGFGFQRAFLVEAVPGQPFKAIKGDYRI